MIAAETETEKYQQPRRQSPHLGGFATKTSAEKHVSHCHPWYLTVCLANRLGWLRRWLVFVCPSHLRGKSGLGPLAVERRASGTAGELCGTIASDH